MTGLAAQLANVANTALVERPVGRGGCELPIEVEADLAVASNKSSWRPPDRETQRIQTQADSIRS
jgi:hypothetical protein